MTDKIDYICSVAERKCSDLERFPGYFRFKKLETLNIIDKLGDTKNAVTLEIGCGTGFQSAILAALFDKTISTDFLHFSKATHTIGLKSARDITARLGISNLDHLACSAIDLPFKDNSFSHVFLFGVLEHIDNKEAALKEIKRILKNDGIAICSVPTYVESLFQFPALYLYILKRTFDTINTRVFKRKVNHKSIFFSNDNDRAHRKPFDLVMAFFRNNPSFPFPEPHGDWKNKKGKQSIFVEFYAQLPWNWKRLFSRSGLKISKSFGVLYIPYRIIEIFSPRFLTWLFYNTQFLHREFADSLLKYFSTVICYVAKKQDDALT